MCFIIFISILTVILLWRYSTLPFSWINQDINRLEVGLFAVDQSRTSIPGRMTFEPILDPCNHSVRLLLLWSWAFLCYMSLTSFSYPRSVSKFYDDMLINSWGETVEIKLFLSKWKKTMWPHISVLCWLYLSFVFVSVSSVTFLILDFKLSILFPLLKPGNFLLKLFFFLKFWVFSFLLLLLFLCMPSFSNFTLRHLKIGPCVLHFCSFRVYYRASSMSTNQQILSENDTVIIDTCYALNETWFTISSQSEWLLSKSLQTINAGEDVEQRQPSYIVGGNAN